MPVQRSHTKASCMRRSSISAIGLLKGAPSHHSLGSTPSLCGRAQRPRCCSAQEQSIHFAGIQPACSTAHDPARARCILIRNDVEYLAPATQKPEAALGRLGEFPAVPYLQLARIDEKHVICGGTFGGNSAVPRWRNAASIRLPSEDSVDAASTNLFPKSR